ncbi:HAD family phosphatase [Gleimia sp. 6138-11-ORH1]|uniref:HAD family hydrolase n=1 Tax=Gleimia sp. 6138-11-ORH1 TaxID=2973937 RepID=UPI00216910CD|nr:HAD family phosphatase [Gleimia sp. 6138-11-ORH1]MCS4484285.1 HAD family phosphatase [Gleimia sp. 6138-11-ORH1]
MQLPKAMLFDMDGTLIDSELYWQTAEVRLFASLGQRWLPEHSDQLAGNSLTDSIEIMRRATGVELDTEQTVSYLVDSVHSQVVEGGVPWLPGALETLTLAKELGIKTALVTSSYRKFTQAVIDRSPADIFDISICGDEVEFAKPDPFPYLEAARLLGVDPLECMAFEDSVSGTQAALASGALTVVTPGVNPPPFDARAIYLSDLTVINHDWLQNSWLRAGRSRS